MEQIQPSAHFDNPFNATRFQPGRLPFRFAAGCGAPVLVEQLSHQSWRGAIVGPHGSGKTTLLHALLPEIERRGRKVVWFTQRGGQKRLEVNWSTTRNWSADTLIVVDGFEQLGTVHRTRLQFLCARRKSGLLVTAHAPVRLPTLFVTVSSPELTRALVRELAGKNITIATDIIDAAHARQAGNVREVFFDLYDHYERQSQDFLSSSR